MSDLATNGYQIIPQLLPDVIVDRLLKLIQANSDNEGFGIRNFLANNPEVVEELRGTSSINTRRRVIHLEFLDATMVQDLALKEAVIF